MKRTLILLTAMVFSAGSAIFAADAGSRRSFNILSNFRGGIQELVNSFDIPRLNLQRDGLQREGLQRGRAAGSARESFAARRGSSRRDASRGDGWRRDDSRRDGISPRSRGYARALRNARESDVFNGNDLTGWQFKSITNPAGQNHWKVGTLQSDEATFTAAPPTRGERGALINVVPMEWRNLPAGEKGGLIYTESQYGDCKVKLEFLVPKGSNSGVYLMGEYEVQINADTFGKADDQLGQGDMGAIYSAASASVNASGEPGTWQTYEIEFVAPTFDAEGNKISNALFKKIWLNGKVVQENVQVEKPTGGGLTMKEAATGPLMLQGDHGPVAFRNIEVIVP